MCGGELGYGAVEEERVAVGYKEGLGRVVVEYVGLHVGAFAFHDVGWVADDEVVGGVEGGELEGVEDVELSEVDVGVVEPGVVLSHGKGGRGEVDGCYCCLR